jgi:hypothetical protein
MRRDYFARGTVLHVQTDTFWAFLRTYSWPSQKHLNNFLFVKVPVAISHYSCFVGVDFGERLIVRKQQKVCMTLSCAASTSSHGHSSSSVPLFFTKLGKVRESQWDTESSPRLSTPSSRHHRINCFSARDVLKC